MLETALLAPLNHLLHGADWARTRLRPFAGKTVRFEIPPVTLPLALDSSGLFAAHPGDLHDVIVRLPADTPFLLLQGIDRVMAAAHVEGNAEFATALSFVLRHLRWDAEEDLSRLLGDIVAHRLVQGARSVHDWQQQAATALTDNLVEYFAHESAALIARPEFEAWQLELTDFTRRLDGLEARVAHLPSA